MNPLGFFRAFLVGLALNVTTSAHAAVGDGPNMWGVAASQSMIVSVGERGAIYAYRGAGTDVLSVSKCASGVDAGLYGIAFGNGRFVAVGDEGISLVSTDLLTWSAARTGISARLRQVAYGQGKFVALSEQGDVLISTDGTTWQRNTSEFSGWLRGLVYGGDQWVATGQGGAVLTSPDAVQWTRRNSGVTVDLEGVTFGAASVDVGDPARNKTEPAYYLAVGDAGTVLVSSDGVSWQSRSFGTTEKLRGVGIMTKQYRVSTLPVDITVRYFAVGENGSIRLSYDTATWTAMQPSTAPSFTVRPVEALRAAVPYNNGVFAVGANGLLYRPHEPNSDFDGIIAGPDWQVATAFTPSWVARKMVNVSTRGQVGTGANVLIAGFVVTGKESIQVLVRAVGPGLAPFAVEGTLSDPQFIVTATNGSSQGMNDNWGQNLDQTSEAIAAAAVSTGAFALPAGSKDAARILTLNPGGYTVQVSGVGGAIGIALVEAYELPLN